MLITVYVLEFMCLVAIMCQMSKVWYIIWGVTWCLMELYEFDMSGNCVLKIATQGGGVCPAILLKMAKSLLKNRKG